MTIGTAGERPGNSSHGPGNVPHRAGSVPGDNQALALHLAGSFARSPHALALVLEAAGPTAIRLVGELLHRRMRDAP